MISEYSLHYKSIDRIQGLLLKISNEIIKRCKATINIDDMLDGDVEKCMEDLNNSISCGRKWRTIYEKNKELIENSKSPKVIVKIYF